MENGISEEREIDLWDMFWAICQKWRLICLCALAGAILAGVVSYLRSDSAETAAFEELSEDDQSYVRLYLDYFEAYQNQMLYNDEAPLMQLDANGFYVGTLDYFVDNHYEVEYPVIAKNDNLTAIIQTYRSSLDDSGFREEIQKELGINDERMASYILELIDCDNAYGMKSGNVDSDNVMRISIYADNEETCSNLEKIVSSAIEQKKADVVKQFGQHDVILVNETCNLVADNDLLTYQKNSLDKLYAQSTNLANVKKLLSSEAQSYLEQLMADESENHAINESGVLGEAEVQPHKASVSKKLVLIGFVAGAFLVVALGAMAYLLNNRLLYEDDFEELFGVKLFGRIEKKRKKRLFGFVDEWMIGLRRMKQHHFEEEEAVQMIYTGIKLAARKGNVSTIYVTGAGLDLSKEPALEQVAAKLEKENIHLEIGDSIISCAEALERVAEIGTVVLAEKSKESAYWKIQEEIKACRQLDVHLLGAVVIE